MTETAVTSKRRSHALSLPNLLTNGRCLAVPVVAALLLGSNEDWSRWTALGVYAAAGITDFLDGYLARVWQMQSPIGRMLDPIADKLLVAATLLVVLLLMAACGAVADWPAYAGIAALLAVAAGLRALSRVCEQERV